MVGDDLPGHRKPKPDPDGLRGEEGLADPLVVDPSGRMLVVANLLAMPVRDSEGERIQPATLSTYRIGADGKLTFIRTYDIETNGMTQWWSGFVRV